MSVGLVELVERMAPVVCTELFASYDVSLRRRFSAPSADEALGPRVVGSVDVWGERVRGTIVVAAGFPLLAACCPTRQGCPPLSDAFASDWLLVRDRAAGLALALLDRARARAVGYEDAWHAGTSRAFSGDAIEAVLRHRRARPLVFDALGDAMQIWFDLENLPATLPPPSHSSSWLPPPTLRAPSLPSASSFLAAPSLPPPSSRPSLPPPSQPAWRVARSPSQSALPRPTVRPPSLPPASLPPASLPSLTPRFRSAFASDRPGERPGP
ncbi:MAG: hypothetical protein MUF34_02045 [Polyangiaceae bacterium]|nr:hypothetical protein [Polyangiaceae bacterium]